MSRSTVDQLTGFLIVCYILFILTVWELATGDVFDTRRMNDTAKYVANDQKLQSEFETYDHLRNSPYL